MTAIFWLGTSAALNTIRHRQLVWAMIQRDLQGRYRGSLLGALWTLLSPLALIVLYTLFFGIFLQVRAVPATSVADFGLFVMAGLVPWIAISEGITRAASAILDNRTLVKKVIFPLEILPANVVLAALVGQAIGLGVLAAATWSMHGRLPSGLLLLPAILVPQVLLTLGLAWFLASIGVFIRDIGQILSLLLTGWMFGTPIFYAFPSVPDGWRWVIAANPLTHLVAGYRSVLLGSDDIDYAGLGTAMLLSLLICLLGGAWFQRTKHAFADVL
jgi:lipopolysaccharide transport system permease protein